MKRLRSFALVAVVGAAGIMPVVGTSQSACASSSSAALVIDAGGSVHDYCVAISGPVTGLDLIKLAGQQYGLSYNLGFGGKAVCALAGVGVTESSDCFAAMPDFWGFWIGNGSGGWTWSSVGAGSVSVGPGGIQGWTWGAGKDGGSHPAPPATAYSSVCKNTGGGGGAGGSGSSGNAGGSGSGSNTGGAGSGAGSGGGADGASDGTGGGASSSQTGGEPAKHTSTDPATIGGINGSSASTGERPGARSNGPRPPRHTPAPQPVTALGAGQAEASPVVLAAPITGAGGHGPPAGGFLVLLAAAILGLAGFYATRGRGARHRASRVGR